MLLAALSPDFAQAQQVSRDDTRLKTERLSYPSPDGHGTVNGYLKTRSDCSGKLGVVGFCWGGGIAHVLATRLPELDAAVPFYGNHPPAEEAVKVKAPLLIHFAAVDERINAAWPAYEAALKAAEVRYTAHVYAGTQHGFNNDTTPRFDTASAKLAWERTLAFFEKNLKG